MSLPSLGSLIDERFLMHRLRSTSLAGVIGGSGAILLFAYRYYFDHLWSWDLFAVGVTVAVVKVAAMIWYRCTD
jgi:hypothetical protein